jgi:hypothetical protein
MAVLSSVFCCTPQHKDLPRKEGESTLVQAFVAWLSVWPDFFWGLLSAVGIRLRCAKMTVGGFGSALAVPHIFDPCQYLCHA